MTKLQIPLGPHPFSVFNPKKFGLDCLGAEKGSHVRDLQHFIPCTRTAGGACLFLRRMRSISLDEEV